MELKKGYKKTEFGVIPEDWEVKPLGTISSVSSGGTPNRMNATYWDGNIPWVTTSLIDFNEINNAEEFITELGLKNSAAKLLTPGTILLALYGQGKTRGKVGILGITATTNQACASINLSKTVSQKFVFHYLVKQYDAIRGLSNSGSQDNLNSQIVKSILIPLPPLPEQRAIAEALSDVDALLEALDRLIDKKRNIKQATMQQLLTGKKRLPGFEKNKEYKQTEVGMIPEDWEVTSIGSLIYNLRGGASLKPNDFVDTGIKIIPKSGVNRTGFLKIDENEIQYCSNSFADLHQNNLIDQNFTVVVLRDLVPSGPNIGLVVDIREKGNYLLAQGVYGFKTTKQLDSKYLVYLSNTHWYRKRMNIIMVGSTQVHITNSAFKDINIPLPNYLEQIAIGTFLSEMDSEITALEKRREKTNALKQAMMQELLTGKTRLV
jgi:type I restriction enzyme S subunit